MRKSGFTLIELSIVLVIVGLIIGGVLGGQELVRSAELQNVTKELTQFKVALNTFRLKYNALPGDMADATLYWGKDAANCSGAAGNASTPGTCNGDGNNLIDHSSGSAADNYRGWQHLALSGLLPGSYTGIIAGAYPRSVPGSNVPASKIPGAGWMIWGIWAPYGFANSQNEPYLYFGTPGPYLMFTDGGALTPVEALNIDKKIDDGLPAGGNVYGGSGYGISGYGSITPNCISSYTVSAAYNLSQPDKLCSLAFKAIK